MREHGEVGSQLHAAFIDGLAGHRGVDGAGAHAVRSFHAISEVIDEAAPELFGAGELEAAVLG